MPRDIVTPADEVLSILTEARQWLSDPTHWVKYRFWSGEGNCALGALELVGGERWTTAYPPLADALPKTAKAESTSIALYNDAPSTTHVDILALFDRAIIRRRHELMIG